MWKVCRTRGPTACSKVLYKVCLKLSLITQWTFTTSFIFIVFVKSIVKVYKLTVYILFILQIVTVPAKKKVLQVHALNEDRFVSRKDISVPDQVVTMVCAVLNVVVLLVSICVHAPTHMCDSKSNGLRNGLVIANFQI